MPDVRQCCMSSVPHVPFPSRIVRACPLHAQPGEASVCTPPLHTSLASPDRPANVAGRFANRSSPPTLGPASCVSQSHEVASVPPSRAFRVAFLSALRTAPASGSGPSYRRRPPTTFPASTPLPPGLHGGSPAPPAAPPSGSSDNLRASTPIPTSPHRLTPACSGLATLAADARR
jgi:hypothetical protein